MAGGEEIGGDEGDVLGVGRRPVGERGRGQAGHHVVARVLAAVDDVLGELVVQELEWVVRGPTADEIAEAGLELAVVGLGHALQVGDDEEREGAGVLADELALTFVEELVQLPVAEPPHELLVLAEALRRDEPHQQTAMGGVHGRIERWQLVAERQLVAVLVDDPADIVTLEGHCELHEGAGDGVARRVGRGVVVDRHGLLVAGDHEHAVVGLLPDRVLVPQPVVVGVGVVVDGAVLEEVDGLELAHDPVQSNCSAKSKNDVDVKNDVTIYP